MTSLNTLLESKCNIDENWKIGSTPDILKEIKSKEINIVLYEREIPELSLEINRLLKTDVNLNFSGEIHSISEKIQEELPLNQFKLINQDIQKLLLNFNEITGSTNFKLLFKTITTNMCRKFHTDINDLRMLCTYSGPGTLWLTNDNINQKALKTNPNQEYIVLNNHQIKQAKTGAVVLLKGALFPQKNNKAILHRSPPIENRKEKRLLLRIDTNNTLNFEI